MVRQEWAYMSLVNWSSVYMKHQVLRTHASFCYVMLCCIHLYTVPGIFQIQLLIIQLKTS